MNPVQFKLSGKTNVGCIRQNNEDNFIVNPDLCEDQWMLPANSETVFTLGRKGALLVVADGMGGLEAGEVASRIAVDTMKEFFAPGRIDEDVVESDSTIRQFMKNAIIACDTSIKNACRDADTTREMGTTVVAAWILDGYVYVSWCGDSRLYIFDSMSGLTQLTTDHSYVQDLVDAGKLPPEQVFGHPYSNIITRSLGSHSEQAEPDFAKAELNGEMCLLLCTDGLNSMLQDFEIDNIIQHNSSSLDSCTDALIKEALNSGGDDNVTVILGQIIAERKPSPYNNNKSMITTIYEHEKTGKSFKIILLLLLLLITGVISICIIKGLIL